MKWRKSVNSCGRRVNFLLLMPYPAWLCLLWAMDEWNIDAAVAASQKGLMTSAGLGLVAIGLRVWERAGRSKMPRFYFDWKQMKDAAPFTPALSLLFELEAALDFIQTQGMSKIFERRAQVADRIRNLVSRSGMEVYALK